MALAKARLLTSFYCNLIEAQDISPLPINWSTYLQGFVRSFVIGSGVQVALNMVKLFRSSEKMFTLTHSPVIFKPSVLKLGVFLGSFSGIYKVKKSRYIFGSAQSTVVHWLRTFVSLSASFLKVTIFCSSRKLSLWCPVILYGSRWSSLHFQQLFN